MADGTRLKVMEDNWRKTENQLQRFIAVTQQNFQDSAKHRAEMELKFDALSDLVRKFIVGSERSSSVANPGGTADARREKSAGIEGSDLQISATEGSDQGRNSSPRLGSAGTGRFPKVDFPVFDGKKPRSWVRKCERYFSIFNIAEGQKVELASMYMFDRADVWVQGYLMQRKGVRWKDLGEAVCARFGEKQGVEVVEEFNKLEQGEDLEEYNERFKELRSGLLAYNSNLPENYFVCSYISGLRPEIKSLVKLGRSDDLAATMELARLHHESVQAILKMSKSQGRFPSVGLSMFKPAATAQGGSQSNQFPGQSCWANSIFEKANIGPMLKAQY